MRRNEISSIDDIIDSRDIMARIDELQSKRDDLEDETGTDDEDEKKAAQQALEEWDDENEEELEMWKAVADSGIADFNYGVQLINENYFIRYCQELLQDIGDLPHNLPGYIVIDWEATADNIKADYTEIDIGGNAYFVRA